MGTYGDLQATIADDLMRGDLTAQIQKAILDAIKQYERETFYFNQVIEASFNTVAHQEFYGAADFPAIATMASIGRVRIMMANNRYTLNKRTWQYLDDTSVNPSVAGLPVDYAYFAEQIRFYPIPAEIWPVTLSGTPRLTALAALGDENAWTDDAEELIRCAAKRRLFMHVLLDDANTQRMVAAERDALIALRGETTRRGTSGRMRASTF